MNAASVKAKLKNFAVSSLLLTLIPFQWKISLNLKSIMDCISRQSLTWTGQRFRSELISALVM